MFYSDPYFLLSKAYCCLFILLFSPLTSSFSQTNNEQQIQKNKYEAAKALKEKGDQFLINEKLDSALMYLNEANAVFESMKKWVDYISGKMSTAVCFYYQSQFDSCEYHLEQFIDIYEKHHIENEDLWMNANNLLSILYSVKGDYNLAINTVLQDIDRILSKDKMTNYDSSSVANYYNSLGAWYTMKEDYDRALDYLRHTALYYEKLGVDPEESAFINWNIAQVLSFKGANKAAVAYLKKNIDIANTFQTTSQRDKIKKKSFNGLSVIYREMNQLDSAMIYTRKAIETATNYQSTVTNRNMGKLYVALGKPNQAIPFLQKAEQGIIDEKDDRELEIVNIYIGLGDAYSSQKNYPQALNYYQKALFKNSNLNPPSDWKEYPPLTDISRPDYFLTSIHQKAKTIALLSPEKENQELALATYQTCIKWIDSMRMNIVSEGSQLFWRNKVREIYGEAIEIAHNLYNLNKDAEALECAFTFSEKSKGILLLESRKASEGKAIGGVPDSLIQKEKDLKIDIAFFQKKLKGEKEEKKGNRFQQYLYESRLALASLKEQIESDYAEVHLNINADFSTSLAEVRETLKEKEVLIEYFLTNTALYAFLISHEAADFVRLANRSDVEQKITELKKHLLNPQGMNTDAQKTLSDFDQSASNGYQLLVAPLISSLTKNIDRLFIIPDGPLYHIPFEVLTTSKLSEPTIDFAKLNYLGNQYFINYGYSFNLLEENFQNKVALNTNQKCLAAAPQYLSESSKTKRSIADVSRGEVANLEGTAREIKAISQYFSGQFHYGLEATKTNFLNQIEQHGLLHLAMHGVVDYEHADFAHFLFSTTSSTTDNHQLYHYEISNLDLNTQLAVLSACETGLGKYEAGEGVFSLARGFMEAGVPSVVMSLWKVNDLSTSELMPLFYKGLADGLAIDRALGNAKQQYLSNADLRYRHPYFWSGFVSLGDPNELKGNGFKTTWFLIIGGLLLLFFTWMGLLKFRKK